MIMEPSPLPLRKPSRLRKAAPFIIVGLVLMGFVGWAGVSALRRAQCGAFAIYGLTDMREIHRPMRELAESGATGLVDVRRLLLENPAMLEALDAHLTSRCSNIDRPIPIISGVRLRRLANDPALRARVAAELLPPTDEWAQIGAMRIWQRVEAYSSYDARMIVGYVPTLSYCMGVMFADGHASLIYAREMDEMLERDTTSRAELGQPPLPREWFVLPPRK